MAGQLHTSNAEAGRGRPRDPDLEDRVFDTAIALYAAGGWSAFTFEAIARESGVGKSSLYRRWPDRGTLLADTFEARWIGVQQINTGTLRGDLTELAEMMIANLTGDNSDVDRWASLDATAHPEVRSAIAPYKQQTVLQARAITHRAAARGEVSRSLNAGLLMDIVVGAVTNHVATTPQHLRKAMLKKNRAFVESLIDVVLKGVGARELGKSDDPQTR
jgi:AcrR family transcriptional regulator